MKKETSLFENFDEFDPEEDVMPATYSPLGNEFGFIVYVNDKSLGYVYQRDAAQKLCDEINSNYMKRMLGLKGEQE